jgi:hypothetical protein
MATVQNLPRGRESTTIELFNSHYYVNRSKVDEASLRTNDSHYLQVVAVNRSRVSWQCRLHAVSLKLQFPEIHRSGKTIDLLDFQVD